MHGHIYTLVWDTISIIKRVGLRAVCLHKRLLISDKLKNPRFVSRQADPKAPCATIYLKQPLIIEIYTGGGMEVFYQTFLTIKWALSLTHTHCSTDSYSATLSDMELTVTQSIPVHATTAPIPFFLWRPNCFPNSHVRSLKQHRAGILILRRKA